MLLAKTLRFIKNNKRDIKKEGPGLEKKHLQKHLCRWSGFHHPAGAQLGLGSSFLMGQYFTRIQEGRKLNIRYRGKNFQTTDEPTGGNSSRPQLFIHVQMLSHISCHRNKRQREQIISHHLNCGYGLLRKPAVIEACPSSTQYCNRHVCTTLRGTSGTPGAVTSTFL